MLQSLTGAHFCGQCIGQRKEQSRIMQTTIMAKAAHSDVYLTFDRYYDYSIKSVTRGARAGKHARRRHHMNLSSPLPPQKVVLTVNENKIN